MRRQLGKEAMGLANPGYDAQTASNPYWCIVHLPAVEREGVAGDVATLADVMLTSLSGYGESRLPRTRRCVRGVAGWAPPASLGAAAPATARRCAVRWVGC